MWGLYAGISLKSFIQWWVSSLLPISLGAKSEGKELMLQREEARLEMRKQLVWAPWACEETGFPRNDFHCEVSRNKVPLGQVPCFACIHSRLVHTYVRKLGLKLNKFIQYDGNTWFLINGKHYRTREVKANPELLGYSMNPKEKGKNAMNLFYQSIEKVTPASPIPGSGKNRVHRSPGKLMDGPRPPGSCPVLCCLVWLPSNTL